MFIVNLYVKVKNQHIPFNNLKNNMHINKQYTNF